MDEAGRSQEDSAAIGPSMKPAHAALGAGEHCGACMAGELGFAEPTNPAIHKCTLSKEVADLRTRLAEQEQRFAEERTVHLAQNRATREEAEARLAAVEAERDRAQALLADEAMRLGWLPPTQADALATALARYGRHDDDCAYLNAPYPEPRPSCTCGFDTTLKGTP